MASLPAITALARSGAIERAWEAFVTGGYSDRRAEPGALAVKGRLLKDKGRLAASADRQALFAEAAEAYSRAHAIDPAPYLAINTATLHLLAGDPARSQAEAAAVLAMLGDEQAVSDTPYYLAATRAEALLLLNDEAGALAALKEAAAADPDGWHDRAGTIAQLREIARTQARSDAWLEPFAPPASLHFAGHIGIAAGGSSEQQLARALEPFLARERIGFAWGALAAGADIVIAERLLAAGCELHAVLPCPPDLFEAQSVAPAGASWTARYRALLGAAASLRSAGEGPAAVHDPLATGFAGELAIGGALLNARALSARVLQLVVTDEHGGGANTAVQARMWRPQLGEQQRLTVPRDQSVEALFPPEKHDPARALAVHGVIALDGLGKAEFLQPSAIAQASAPIAEALGALPSAAVRAAPGRWDFVATDFALALAVLHDIQHRCSAAGTPLPAAGAHLAIGSLVHDPASDTLVPYGPGPALAQTLQARAPAGSIVVSDALAVTLAARGSAAVRTELFHFGEDESEGAVHLLLPQAQAAG